MDSSNPEARCPTCGRRFTWNPDSPYRPFCSERCQLIDLGEWMDEGHRIPDKGPASPWVGPENGEND